MGASRGCGGHARRSRLASRHRPVPRRRARGRRPRACWSAAAIGLLTTVCCAWRWTIVARGLGVHLVAARRRRGLLPVGVPQPHAPRRRRRRRPSWRQPRARRARRRPRPARRRLGAHCRAVRAGRADDRRPARAAVARALVHAARGVRAGRDCRSPSSLVDRARSGAGRSRWARVRNAVAADIRAGLLHRQALPAIALASAVVVLGHAVTFLVAARTAGVTAPLSRLLPLALLAMLAMVLPSVAGWGPREGVTAWVSPRPASVRVVAQRPRSPTASWCSPPACRGRSCSSQSGSRGARRRLGRRPCRASWTEAAADARASVHAPFLQHVDRRLHRQRRLAAAALQRGGLRPRRRCPRLLRRDPRRRGDGSDRQPAAPRALAGPSRRARRARPRAVADEGDGDPAGGPRRACRLLHRRRREKLVYCASPWVADARERLGTVATVVDGGGEAVDMRTLSTDLAARGVERLMVEGGSAVHTQFLTEDLVDELQLTVAPVFLGDSRGSEVRARRLLPVEPGPSGGARRRSQARRCRAPALRPLVAVRGWAR